MQRTVLFNLTRRSLPSLTILVKKEIARSAFFHNFASFQVNKCPLYGQMYRGLKSTSDRKQRAVLFNPTQKVFVASILFKKKFAKLAFVHYFASFQGEQMSTLRANGDKGFKSTSRQQCTV